MSLKKQKEKAAAARSLTFTGALLGGIISAAIGVLLGFFNLAWIPVTEVREIPSIEERSARTVYYAVGQERGGSSYRGKLTALLQGDSGTLRLNESDLNTWARDTFKFSAPDSAQGNIRLKPAAPRFSIKDGLMTISMPMEIDTFGHNRRVLLQAQGTFLNDGSEWIFVPSNTYVGSALVPEGAVADALCYSLLKIFKGTEDYEALNSAWSQLTQVNLTGDELILVRR